jgi:hypothetical protein
MMLALAWPAALVAAIHRAIGAWGFNPTDEGLIQAGSYRILCGEVPHRDWISPRPVLSYLVHTADFALPGPLFEMSRLVAIAEFAIYSILFAWLIYRAPPWRWGFAMVAGAAASVLVNMHVFLLTSWYTVDGLLLVAAGLVLVREGAERARPALVRSGFLCLGLALITKQSFFLGPVLGGLLVAPYVRSLPSRRQRAVELAWAAGAVAAPVVAYAVGIACTGGLRAMATQLTSGSFVYGRELVTKLGDRHELRVLAWLLVAEVSVLLLGRFAAARRMLAVDVLAKVALSALFVAVPLAQGLAFFGSTWGIRLVWMLSVFLVLEARDRRALDSAGLAVLGTSWMAMLTWGLPVPNLMGGTLVLFVLDRTWRVAPERSDVESARSDVQPERGDFATAWVRALTFGAALIVVGCAFWRAHVASTYLDATPDRLTASLDHVSPELGGLRTNPTTAQYMEQIADCVRRFPARRVAILPANAALYPALRLHNPFPIDWMFPQDFRGSYARLLDTVDALNREGDYLVLFQTQGGSFLASMPRLVDATPSTPIFRYDDEHATPVEIYERLNGERVPCGSFIAVHAR